MGNIVKSRLLVEGKSFDGEALFETDDIRFRGETRLTIPLSKITSVSVDGGDLRIAYGDAIAVLRLGADAAKWAEKIRHPKSVLQKLGIQAGQKIALVHFRDDAFANDLVNAGAHVTHGRAAKNSDVIFYGANTRADLARMEMLGQALAPNGALWVIRPKGVKEITESETMAAGKAAGLVDVKVVRFSPTHTAEKFVVPSPLRAGRGD